MVNSHLFNFQIGDHCVVDPTAEEEACGAASIVISVTESTKITALFKVGIGSFHQQTLKDTLKVNLILKCTWQ